MTKILPELLDLDPCKADNVAAAARELAGLANWWLGPSARETIRKGLPQFAPQVANYPLLRSQPGCAAIFFAVAEGRASAMLPDAYVLPVKWIESGGIADDLKLPPAVRKLADQVRRDLSAVPSVKNKSWSLIGNADAMPDLSDLCLPADSGWGSLASGLIALAENGRPNPAIACSCAWDSQRGITAVDFLPQKQEAAARHGVKRFFVPEIQRGALAPPSGMEIGGLVTIYERYTIGGTFSLNPRASMQPLLGHLALPPHDKITTQAEFLDVLPWAAVARKDQMHPLYREYYLRALLPAIVEFRLRRPSLHHTNRLVAWVSPSPEVAAMVAVAVGAHQVLALWDGTSVMERYVRDFTNILASLGKHFSLNITPVPTPVAEHLGLFTGQELLNYPVVEKFFAEAGEEPIGFDVTPGKTGQKLALYELTRPRDVIFYIEHRYDRGSVVGEEHLYSALRGASPLPC